MNFSEEVRADIRRRAERIRADFRAADIALADALDAAWTREEYRAVIRHEMDRVAAEIMASDRILSRLT